MDTIAALASLAALGYGLSYVFMCTVFPFGDCRRCKGTGKLRNPLIRSMYRLCPRCRGHRMRVRIGRRIYEHIAREYRQGRS